MFDQHPTSPEPSSDGESMLESNTQDEHMQDSGSNSDNPPPTLLLNNEFNMNHSNSQNKMTDEHEINHETQGIMQN